jgi:hypothetical protein
MKNLTILMIITITFILYGCKKDNDKDTERFRLITGVTWTSQSLLVNNVDESAGMLAGFKGDVKFNEDGTGTFTTYSGTWAFNSDETQLIINTSAVGFTVVADIAELTATTLRISTIFPNPLDLTKPLSIQMTFKAK